MTRSQLESFRAMIRKNLGITVPVAKNYLLESRIEKVLKDSGISDADDLLRTLQGRSPSVWETFVDRVTTHHTYFWREFEHFEIMVQSIAQRKLGKVAIWVAASSTGEEVYSIALSLLGAGLVDFRIMASDINRVNLIALKKGIYPQERLAQVPIGLRQRYFADLDSTQSGSDALCQAKPELKRHIFARQLNLLDNLHFEAKFDFIFCRNVFMYFPREVQRQVLGMLMRNLASTGYLFVGQSENLIALSAGLGSPFPGVYRRKGGQD